MTNRYRITVQGVTYDVEVGDISSSPVQVTVDGVGFEVEIPEAPDSQSPPTRPSRAEPRPTPRRRPAERSRPSMSGASDSDDVVRAPMPGRIVRVNVATGDSVTQGQAIAVLESMKMENTIAAPRDGVVSQVHVSADESVQHGQSLVELE